MTSLVELREKILAEFKCLGSGNCCKAEGYVYITEQDAIRMADLLKMPLEQFKSQFVQDHQGWMTVASPKHQKACFLDDCNRCKVYAARPLACRTYPHWPEIWQSEDPISKEIASCPGLRRAYATVLNE